MSEKIIVSILGAGCSRACGYPLAGELQPKLRTFVEGFTHETTTQLKTIGETVLEVMRELNTSTLDKLAMLVLDKKADRHLIDSRVIG